MTLASDSIEVAMNLLTEFGELISIQRVVVGAYTPSTSEAVEATPINFSGVGLPTQYDVDMVDGENILESDILLILSSTTEPLVNDNITFNSAIYNAQNVQKIRAQGVDIIYKVQCRS